MRIYAPVRKQNVIWAIWSVSRVTVILFFVCEVNIISHFYHKPPCRPWHSAFLIWDKGRRSIFGKCFLWDKGVMEVR